MRPKSTQQTRAERLARHGNALCVGRSSTPLVSVERDKTWPAMWRVRHGEQLSDVVNASRAREAARCLALSLLKEGVRTGLAASPVEQNGAGLIALPDATSKPLHANDDEGRRTGLVIGQVARARGGRGKRGGVSEAARQAGISRFAAYRAIKRVRASESTRLGSVLVRARPVP
jgi:hypothetical protein